MDVTYVNPDGKAGDVSTLLKFHPEVRNETGCLLIDAGDGLCPGELPGDNEELVGILITHAHADHTKSLLELTRATECPIFASPGTATILEAVISERVKESSTTDEKFDQSIRRELTDRLTPLESQTTVFPGVRIQTVPVGHAPGAAGYIVEFDDQNEPQRLLVTGDWTPRRVAGTPRIPVSYPFDIDALLINCPTRGGDDRDGPTEPADLAEPVAAPELTETIADFVEYVYAGQQVLGCAGGLVSVHLAYLLGHVSEGLDISFPVRIVGQGARLYEELGFDVPNVSAIPDYSSPRDVLVAGGVTLTGPETPRSNGSQFLFNELKSNPNAAVIQVLNRGSDPVHSGQCTTVAHEYPAHPTQGALDAFVEALAPKATIINHGNHDRYGDRYDFSLTWATSSKMAFGLYCGGEWQGPDWIDESTAGRIGANNRVQSVLGDEEGSSTMSVPSPGRAPVDLRAEGLDPNAIPQFDPNALDSLRDKQADTSSPTAEPQSEEQSEASATVDGSETDHQAAVSDGGTLPDRSTVVVDTPELPGSVPGEARGEADSDGDRDADVEERLAKLEAAVFDQESLTATIIDGGDGVRLLRISDDSLEDLSHGDEVTLRRISKD